MTVQSTTEPAHSLKPLPIVIMAVFALIAGALRIAAAQTDFWLDEIWTWHLSLSVHRWSDVFRIHSDNNHYLNTLWFYWLGDRSDWRLYRLPAVAAGIGTVAGLSIIGRRRSRFHEIALPAMAAVCFPLVLYSSEARGYGLATFFTVVCLDQIEQQILKPAWTHCLLFAMASMLGLLSHLTFLLPYCGMVAWAAFRLRRGRTGPPGAVTSTALACLAPLLVLAWLGFVDLLDLRVAGGPVNSASRLLIDLITSTYGVQRSSGAAIALGLVTVLMVALAIARAPWLRSGGWVLYATSLVLAPILAVCARGSALTYPRYLVVCVPIFLLLLTDAAETLCRSNIGRISAWVVVALFCASNAELVGELLKDGRGHYLAATRYLAAETDGAEITISSDQDSRAWLTFSYYSRFLPPGKSIRLIGKDQPELANWRLLTEQDGPPPPTRLRMADGSDFELARSFPYSSRFSGFSWYLYRRLPSR